jgi:hypothetical protein
MNGYAEQWLSSLPWTPFKPNAEVPPYGVMVVDANTSASIKGNVPVIATKKATEPAGFGMQLAINGPENTANGATGRCLILPTVGPVVVAYDSNTGTPAVGEVWGVGDATWNLIKYLPGFVIREAGSGSTVLCDYIPVINIWGKLNANMADDESTGVGVSVWRNDWTADVSGQDLSAVLPPPLMSANTQIDSGEWVRVAVRNDGRHYADMAPC